MTDLHELWRTEIPGDADHAFLADQATSSVYVGDGWSVPFSALRLHRLDLTTGRQIVAIRTRHQQVKSLLISRGNLYAATDSRLFELDPTTLEVRRQWDRGLVAYATQLVADGDWLVMANWLRPSVGIFDPEAGRTHRVNVGKQPIILFHDGRAKTISGFDGGLATLDSGRARLIDRTHTPPIAHAAAGADIWAVAAGPPRGGERHQPVRTRAGSNVLLRLTGEPTETRLAGDVSYIACDDQRQVVWCRSAELGGELWAAAQHTGKVVGPYTAPRGFLIQHVSPAAGIALATAVARRDVIGGTVRSATATCVCLALP
ncbi:MAG TPA: hypothetical protein VFL27_03735 [Candidatus Dormibacteraeota bacterium]|nr:hypothetical protein [Candidatus Dormibacteraeota bacterium]